MNNEYWLSQSRFYQDRILKLEGEKEQIENEIKKLEIKLYTAKIEAEEAKRKQN
jgi:hypothetical protein